jgi:uncharacterized protein (TIGR00251 family)
MPFFSQLTDGTVLLALYVQPKASRTKIVGLFDNCLKIAVAAPPVDGKANGAVVKFLAKALRIPGKNIVIKSGAQSKRKKVIVKSVDADIARDILLKLMAGGSIQK